MRFVPAWMGALAILSGCVAPKIGIEAPGDPAKAVSAVVETVVTTDPAVDADDPELWADPREPSRAVIFAADKSDGLYVHNLDGSVREFFPVGPLNNVDLRNGFQAEGREWVLVAASERQKFGLVTYLFDPATLQTKFYGFIPTDIGEPYGFCLGKRGNDIYAVINNKDGVIQQILLTAGANGPMASVKRTLKVGTQPEGCVVDDEAQVLYTGEEDFAIWQFSFDPAGSTEATRIAGVDNQIFTADIEGLAIMRDAGRKYLVASSQGDSSYPVYRIDGGVHTYVGRFAIVDGPAIDGVTNTDGVAAFSGPIGPYPQGLIAVHDDQDVAQDGRGHRGQQNYKLVDWRDVKRALGL